VTQVQPLVFVADQFVEAAVFLEQVQVVKARDEENVPDPVAHQVLETLKARSVSVLDPEWIQVFFSHDKSFPGL
jgi:hypothetical protein